MHHRVAELEGGRLDVAVAKALGLKVAGHPSEPGWWMVFNADRGGWDTIMESDTDTVDPTVWSPSTKWEHGGPLIERERIAVFVADKLDFTSEWCGVQHVYPAGDGERLRYIEHRGPTPLIAAMRAYVASKFGAEVDVSV